MRMFKGTELKDLTYFCTQKVKDYDFEDKHVVVSDV